MSSKSAVFHLYEVSRIVHFIMQKVEEQLPGAKGRKGKEVIV